MIIKNYLNSRFNTTMWDENKIPTTEQIDYISECAYLAPSKQCYGTTDFLILITDSDEGKEIKKWLFNTLTCELDTIDHGENKKIKYCNGTVNAPFLFVWLIKSDYSPMIRVESVTENIKALYTTPSIDEREKDFHISATCAMFAALELGLNTSFASCDFNMLEGIGDKLGFPGYHVILTLGVGYAKDSSHLERVHSYFTKVDPDLDDSPLIRENIKADENYYQRTLYKKDYNNFLIKI